MGIEDSEEYMLELRMSLAEFTKNTSSNKSIGNCHQSTFLDLNVNAPQFISSHDSCELVDRSAKV